MLSLIKGGSQQDGRYRFTELVHRLHFHFTWSKHTAYRQWFGAGRGQGGKKPLRESPRCQPLSLFNILTRKMRLCWRAWCTADSGSRTNALHDAQASQQRRENLRMTTNRELPDETLSAMAIGWRRKALEGDLHARGIAHELETELRRRAGAPFTNYDTLDMRPLELRAARPRWWRFWRRH